MYANPILLPQYSNREDLLLPISIFDDDLNQAINLSGTTGSGQPPRISMSVSYYLTVRGPQCAPRWHVRILRCLCYRDYNLLWNN
jgi:hypothetical protein